MDMRTQLLDAADRVRAATGLSESRISTLAVNDGKFLRRVRAGRRFTDHTYDKFMRWCERKLTREPT